MVDERYKLLKIILFLVLVASPCNVNATNDSSLYEIIREQAVMDNIRSTYVNNNDGIDFTKISSNENGRGIYVVSNTINNVNPIYYYRGDVDNNNVIFANFCWKIVITTDKGGIKLIYNGTPADGSCANSGSSIGIGKSVFNSLQDSEAYVGYMISGLVDGVFTGNYDNANDSTIKKFVDEWYKDNMLDYTDELEDTIFCSDRSKSVSDNTYYGIYDRIENGTPSLECKNDVDKYTVSKENGNGALKYPVGLLTFDENMYAGGKNYVVNDQYYLFDNGGYYGAFWSLTPYHNGGNSLSNMSFAFDFFAYSTSQVICDWGIRPVVAIKNSGIVVSGDGTDINPYILGKKYAITTDKEYENLQIDNNYSVAGEFIKLNIRDFDNYEVEEVIVTDSLGNIIKVEDNMFEMPEADVTIKLVLNRKIDNSNKDNPDVDLSINFRKSTTVENPQTVDSIVIYFIIFMISIIVFGFLKKRFLFNK